MLARRIVRLAQMSRLPESRYSEKPIHETRQREKPRFRFVRAFAVRLALATAGLLALAFTEGALAASVTMLWDKPTDTTGIAGYQVHYGPASGKTSGVYQSVLPVSGASSTSATVPDLGAGTYYFAVRSRNADGTQVSAFSNEISKTITSSDTTRPTVSLSASPTGTTYTTAQTVTFTATASDNVGVARVEFYDGTTLKATDTSAPYSYGWTIDSAANGSYSWTAKAYDAAGNTATSSPALVRTVSIVSSDTTRPTVSLSASSTGPTYTSAQTVTFTATAGDNVGVARVEFYDGTTLKATDTAAPYSYGWTIDSAANGSHSWTAKAYDAAGNVGTSSALARTVNIAASGCTGSSVWPASATPKTLSDPDTAPVEVGMKFRSDVAGYICGVRFYKSTANTGTHVGSLWSSSGTRLAQATFTQETASGWQQVSFATPIAIQANTVYVVSYLAPKGRYSVDEGYFTSKGVDTAPLHALKSGVSGNNGVYRYGSGGYPTDSYQGSNYWVDVVFAQNASTTSMSKLSVEAEPIAESIGVYRPGTKRFYLDTDGSFDWSAGDTTSAAFGSTGDIAIIGDWTGDGADKIGVYRPSNRAFILDIDGTDSPTTADLTVTSYGSSGDRPVIGDWNGDGIAEIGVYRPSSGRFYLDVDNSYTSTTGDVTSAVLGTSEDLPVAGDWNDDGVDEIGFYRPSTRRFYLDIDNSYSWNTGDVETQPFGSAGDLPVVGDWNADGATDLGVYRPSTRELYLDTNGSDTWTSQDRKTAPFGNAGDKPVSGRWK